MARERIQIRKIDNVAARQVTFSKRRRGLFKKAEELAILCDAQVALIVFSSSGKLYHFASTPSMKDILERHSKHSSENLQKSGQPCIDLNLESNDYASMNREVEEASRGLRQMRGEELERLSIVELQQLEENLEAGLGRVLRRKEEMLMAEITGLQQKGERLMEENMRLTNQLMQMSSVTGRQAANETESILTEERQSSESAMNAAVSSLSQDYDDSSDTALKLGLPCSVWK